MPERPLNERIYRLLVVATIALVVTALSTTGTAAYLLYQAVVMPLLYSGPAD